MAARIKEDEPCALPSDRTQLPPGRVYDLKLFRDELVGHVLKLRLQSADSRD